MKRLNVFLILIAILWLLGDTQVATAQSASDFMQPYDEVQRTVKQQPLLVILLQSQSSPYTYTKSQADIRRLIFGATNSVAAYYLQSSYGQFTFTEAYVTPWLTAQDDPTTTGRNESTFGFINAGGEDIEKEKSAYVIQEAARQTGFDFSHYDANHNGLITDNELTILWIYPQIGGGRERGISPSPVRVDSLSQGVMTNRLARVAEGDPYLLPLIAHELGHVALKLDDLYAEPSLGSIGNVGYTLMSDQQGTCNPMPAGGCFTAPDLDPWSKIKLGWLTPQVVTGDGWYTLADVETTPSAYILYNPAHGMREYFIVENRWPSGTFENGLPDAGLAIWHIDEHYAGSQNWGRRTIHLERARGTSDSERWASLWEGADPLREYAFTPNSYPANSRWQDGSSSSLAVSCVSASGPTMTVFFDVPPLREARQFVSAPAVANSSDGSLLNLFSLAGNGYVTQSSYVRGGGDWSDWSWLPGDLEFTGAPAVINSPDGSVVDVFATGKDGYIYEITYARGGGGWQSWSRLPGGIQFVSSPAAINSPDGSVLDVFATGSDGNLYEIVYARGGGGWGSWSALPGGIAFASAPAVINSPDGSMLDVFATGYDGNLYEMVYVRGGTGWSGWSALPGGVAVTGAPAVVNSPDGWMLDVFAVDGDGYLYELVYDRSNGSWSGWQYIVSSNIASAPAVVNSPDGRLLDVFVLGLDGNIYQLIYVRGGGGWQEWQSVTEATTECS